MDVMKIILQLRTEGRAVEKAILSAERLNRLINGRKIEKPLERIISELRSDREHIRHALLSLRLFYRLTQGR